MVEVNDLGAPRGQLVCSQLQVEVPPGGRRRHQNWRQPVHVQLHDPLGPCSLPSSMGRGVGGTNRPAATLECASSAPSVVRRSGPPIQHQLLPAPSREMAAAPRKQPTLPLDAVIPRLERRSDRPHGPEKDHRRSCAYERVRWREFTATQGDATPVVCVGIKVLADVTRREHVESAVGGCRCRAEATDAFRAAHHLMGGRRPAAGGTESRRVAGPPRRRVDEGEHSSLPHSFNHPARRGRPERLSRYIADKGDPDAPGRL